MFTISIVRLTNRKISLEEDQYLFSGLILLSIFLPFLSFYIYAPKVGSKLCKKKKTWLKKKGEISHTFF